MAAQFTTIAAAAIGKSASVRERAIASAGRGRDKARRHHSRSENAAQSVLSEDNSLALMAKPDAELQSFLAK